MRLNSLILAAPLAALGACAQPATDSASAAKAAAPEIRAVQYKLTGLS